MPRLVLELEFTHITMNWFPNTQYLFGFDLHVLYTDDVYLIYIIRAYYCTVFAINIVLRCKRYSSAVTEHVGMANGCTIVRRFIG